MSEMFLHAFTFNQNIGNLYTNNVTDMSSMFKGAILFNNAGQPMLTSGNSWLTTNVRNMNSMFAGDLSFNVGSPTTTTFNVNINNWNTSNVTDMGSMFFYDSSFNQNISSWNITNVTNSTNFAVGCPGLLWKSWNNIGPQPDISSPFFVQPPCFGENTKILTDKGYVLITELKKGDLVKTLLNGFVPIHMIGFREMYSPLSKNKVRDQLYKCTQENYPEVFEDLIITGAHSLLVDEFEENQRKETEEVLGNIYITDDKYRLPVCVDKRSEIYEESGCFTIYHIALENPDYYMNYGIYANGLLVETCSKRYLKEISQMNFIE